MGRCAHQVAHPVKTDVVRLNGTLFWFQIYQRHVFGTNVAFPDFNTRAVDHIVAVRFNDKGMLQFLTERNEQGSQLRLTPGMQVHFRLLYQKAERLALSMRTRMGNIWLTP